MHWLNSFNVFILNKIENLPHFRIKDTECWITINTPMYRKPLIRAITGTQADSWVSITGMLYVSCKEEKH